MFRLIFLSMFLRIKTSSCSAPMVCLAKFPMNKEEFAVIRREIARRKGEDDSEASAEEIAVCEKVTGYSFDRLWDRGNALRM